MSLVASRENTQGVSIFPSGAEGPLRVLKNVTEAQEVASFQEGVRQPVVLPQNNSLKDTKCPASQPYNFWPLPFEIC